MKYTEYKEKIIKVKNAKTVAYRFRVLILTIFLAITAVAVTLFNTKGLITSENSTFNRKEFKYGQSFEYSASAFLVSEDDMYYEFSSDNGENWTNDVPVHPGNYIYRPYTYNNYKSKIYGSEQRFSITPKAATIVITSDSVEYGETPEIKCDDLINGDSIKSFDVKYTDFGNVDAPEASIDLTSVRIESTSGEDMTDCYDLSSESKAVTIKKKNITMTMNSYSRMYDGTALIEDSERSATLSDSTPLKDGDTIYRYPTSFVTDATAKTETEIQAIDVGKYVNTVKDNGNMIIKNEKGEDVTRYYQLNVNNGSFVITKRPLVLNYKTCSKVYDGTELVLEEPTIDVSTSLAETDTLTFENAPTAGYKVGNGDYKFTPVIKNKDGKDVTSNYDITNPGAKWSIVQREIKVTADTAEILVSDYRNGETELSGIQLMVKKDEADVDLSSSLGMGDSFSAVTKLKKDGKDFSIDAANSSIKVMHTLDDGSEEDVTACYSFKSVDYSNITFKKKTVKVTYQDIDAVYDGKAHSLDTNVSVTNLDDDAEVQFDNVEYTNVVENEEISDSVLNTRIELTSSNTDITDYYDMSVKTPTVTISKRPIKVSFFGDTKKYGSTLNATFKFDEFDSENNKGLVEGQYINLVDANTNKILGSTKNKTPDAGGYYTMDNLSLDVAGQIRFGASDETADDYINIKAVIYDENGNDVTRNYNISYSSDSSLTMTKRSINITFGNYTHYYDGSEFNLQEMMDDVNDSEKVTISGDGLVAGDTIKIEKDTGNSTRKLDGNDVFTKDNMETKVYENYDLNEYLKIRIMNKNEDVSDNYDIEVNFGTLTIRRVQMVMSADSSYKADQISVYYGQLSGYDGTNVFHDAESSDYYGDNDLTKSYTRNENFSLTGDANPTEKVGSDSSIDIQAKNYSLTYKGNYGYKIITEDKIHFSYEDVNFSKIKIKRRTFEFSLKSTTFYIGESYSFDPVYITENFTTDDSSTDSTYAPYNILTQTESTVNNTTDGDKGKGLASGDRLEFSWKTTLPTVKGTYYLSEYLTWKIVNSKGEDVTNCYQDTNGDPLVAGDTKWYETAQLTYKKIPVISLKTNTVKVEKTYDGSPMFTADGKDENGNPIFSINEDVVGTDYPKGGSVSVKFNSDSLKAQAGTWQMTESDLVSITYTVGGYSFTRDYTDPTDSDENPKALKVEGTISFPEVNIKKAKVSVKLSYGTLSYNGSDEATYQTNAYYDGYKWGLTTESEKKDSDNTHYLTLDVDGLPSNCKLVLVQKSSDLPCEASDSPYVWSDYYDYKIMKSSAGEDDIDVTDNYEFEEGAGLGDLPEFSIRKIKFGFTLGIDKSYEWYENDKSSFTPTFTYKKDMSDTSTDIHPTDFDENVSIEYADGNATCSLETVADDIAVPSIKSLSYSFSVGSIDCVAKWSPNDTSSTMDLDNKQEYQYYKVTKRKLEISFENTEIGKTILSSDSKVSIIESDLGTRTVVGIRGVDTLKFNDYILDDSENTYGTYTIKADTLKSCIKIMNGGVDVTGNYEITVKTDITVEVSKPKLTISFTDKTITYDGKEHSIAYAKPELSTTGGLQIQDVKIKNLTFNKEGHLTVGSYQDSDISVEELTVTFNCDGKSYEFSKDDFESIELVNAADATLTIQKNNYLIECYNFTIQKEKLDGDDTIEAIKAEIRKNYAGKYYVNMRGSGDAMTEFDIIITDLGNGKYEFYIVPTKIMHDGETDVTSCYNDMTSGSTIKKGIITVYSTSGVDYGDWGD